MRKINIPSETLCSRIFEGCSTFFRVDYFYEDAQENIRENRSTHRRISKPASQRELKPIPESDSKPQNLLQLHPARQTIYITKVQFR